MHEITKLIHIEKQFSMSLRQKDHSRFGIRVLVQTRWTVKVASIMSNFKTLQSTWEKAVNVVQDTEIKARIRGVSLMILM